MYFEISFRFLKDLCESIEISELIKSSMQLASFEIFKQIDRSLR